MASIYDPPSYSTVYDNGLTNEFPALSTLSVGAYRDTKPNNLTLGATSNIDVKAMQGIRSYINTSNSFKLFTTDATGSNVVEILSVSMSNNATILSANNLRFNVNESAMIDATVFESSNNYQFLSTNNIGGFLLRNDVSINSNLFIFDNITSYKNIACSGNIFGSTINLFTTTPNTSKTCDLTRVGYSFHVNSYNQLELLRTDQITTDNIITNKVTRIMIFGNTEFTNQDKENPDNFLVMKQFNGLTGTYSNGVAPGLTDIRWSPTTSGSNIYYSGGNVGIGTNSPATAFHVTGTTTVEGDIVPKTDLMYNLGSPTKRFKDLYLSGNTINIGSNKISVDKDGKFKFHHANGHCCGLGSASAETMETTWSTEDDAVFCYSNVGIMTFEPKFPLEVNGAIYAVTYCNLIVDSYTSLAKNKVVSASNISYMYDKLFTASNTIHETQRTTSNALHKAISASNVAFSNAEYLKATHNLITYGTTNLTPAPHIITTLSSTTDFLSLNLGPFMSDGIPRYVQACVFWNPETESAYIDTTNSNCPITLSTESSNIYVNISADLYANIGTKTFEGNDIIRTTENMLLTRIDVLSTLEGGHWRVLSSEDGINWLPFVEISSSSSNTFESFNFEPSHPYQYYRIAGDAIKKWTITCKPMLKSKWSLYKL